MRAYLLKIKNLIAWRCLPDSVCVWLWVQAMRAVDNGGYVCDGAPPVPVGRRLPSAVLRQDKCGRWYFPPIRAEARAEAKAKKRQWRYDQKHQKTTAVTFQGEEKGKGRGIENRRGLFNLLNTVNQSVKESTTVNQSIEEKDNIVNQPNRVGAHAGASHAEECQNSLFPEMNSPEPSRPAAEQKRKPPVPKPWDHLRAAIMEVTAADGRASTYGHAVMVAKDLYYCDPPYTPDEVRQLPAILVQQPWWAGTGGVITIQIVQKHIGLVRVVAREAVVALIDECADLAVLRQRAIDAYLGRFK